MVDAEDLRLVEAPTARSRFSSFASRGRVPNGFSITTRTSESLVLVQPVLAELLGDQPEEVRRRREVEEPVEQDPRLLVELAELLAELLVDGGVVEGPGDVAHLLEQRVEHLRVRIAARELRDRLARQLAVTRRPTSPSATTADQVEPLRQRALVREVVDRRQQLPLARGRPCRRRSRASSGGSAAARGPRPAGSPARASARDGHGLLRVRLP